MEFNIVYAAISAMKYAVVCNASDLHCAPFCTNQEIVKLNDAINVPIQFDFLLDVANVIFIDI